MTPADEEGGGGGAEEDEMQTEQITEPPHDVSDRDTEKRSSKRHKRKKHKGGKKKSKKRRSEYVEDDQAEESDNSAKKSSDEDEEDEEDDNGEALNGFIVAEPEAEEVSEGGGGDSDVDEGLDDDDLDLIAELNAEGREAEGKVRHRGGLKGTGLFEEEDEPGKRGSVLLEDEEWDEGQEYAEDAGMMMGDGRFGRVGAAGLSISQMQAIREVFDDIDAVLRILMGKKPIFVDVNGGDTETAGTQLDKNADATSLAETGKEVASLSQQKLSVHDRILCTDQPERLQHRFKNRVFPVPEEKIQAEAKWMTEKLRSVAEEGPVGYYFLVDRFPDLMGFETGDRDTTTMTDPKAVSAIKHFHQLCPVTPDFAIWDMFNEEKQRRRYKETFKETCAAGAQLGLDTVHGPDGYPIKISLAEEIENCICLVLRMLLQDRVEIPTIQLTRAHLLFPPLTSEVLWKIYEWDLEWWRIEESKRKVRTSLDRLVTSNIISRGEADELISRTGHNEIEVNDTQMYIAHLTALYAPTPTDDDAGPPKRRRRRQEDPVMSLIRRRLIEPQYVKHWQNSILSASHFVANLEASLAFIVDGSTHNLIPASSLPYPPPQPPHVMFQFNNTAQAVAEWLRPIGVNPISEMDTSSSPPSLVDHSTALLKLVYRYLALSIASHSGLRKVIRIWLRKIAFLTSVTTAAGERLIDPGKPEWLCMRLTRKPIRHFFMRNANVLPPATYQQLRQMPTAENAHNWWRLRLDFDDKLNTEREYGTRIKKLEADGLVDVVIHPLSEDDNAPWRFARQSSPDLMMSSGQSDNGIDRSERWKRGKHAYEKLSQRKASSSSVNASSDSAAEWGQMMESDKDDSAVIRDLIERLLACLCPTEAPYPWIEFLRSILGQAVCVYVLPALRAELKEQIYKESHDFVAERCQERLLWFLSEQPPQRLLRPVPSAGVGFHGCELDKSRKGITRRGFVNFPETCDDSAGDTRMHDEDDTLDEVEAKRLPDETTAEEYAKSSGADPHALDPEIYENGVPVQEFPTVLALITERLSSVIPSGVGGVGGAGGGSSIAGAGGGGVTGGGTDASSLRLHAVGVNAMGYMVDHKKLDNIFKYLMAPAPPSSPSSGNGQQQMGGSSSSSSGYGGGATEAEIRNWQRDALLMERLLLNRRTRPNIVAVGVGEPETVLIREFLEYIRNKRLKSRSLKFDIIVVDVQAARVFALSSLCPKDIKNQAHGLELAQALFVARYVQNPLATILNLWRWPLLPQHDESATGDNTSGAPNETMSSIEAQQLEEEGFGATNYFLSLRLHPLQSELSVEKLEPSLCNVVINVVNAVGLNINLIRNVKHLRCTLAFTSGLGPIKAAAILRRIGPEGAGEVTSRRSLLLEDNTTGEDNEDEDDSATTTTASSKRNKMNPIGERVFYNCAAFIRIRFSQETSSEVWDDPLDDSRVHPQETATIAQKVAKDAQEEDAEKKIDDELWAVVKTFKDPKKMEELDLEAYASLLCAKSKPRLLPQLEFIKREIENPYASPLCYYCSPAEEQVFCWSTQQDSSSFLPGTDVSLQVTSVRPSLALSAIPYGVPAVLQDLLEYYEYLRSQQACLANVPTDQLLGRNFLIKGRILNIDPYQYMLTAVASPRCMEVALSQRFIDLLAVCGEGQNDARKCLSPLVDTDLKLASSNESRAIDEVKRHQQSVYRPIKHTLFRAMPLTNIIQTMRVAPRGGRVGSVYFGPNEKNPKDSLVIIIQISVHPFRYRLLAIKETKPKPTGELSSELLMVNRKFAALDEILDVFVNPLTNNLLEIYQHEKYHAHATPDELQEKLVGELCRVSGAQLQWGVCLDDTHSSADSSVRFILIVAYLHRDGTPGSVRDSIYVSSEGFRIWSVSKFEHFRKLVAWWKSEGWKQRAQHLQTYNQLKQKKGGK